MSIENVKKYFNTHGIVDRIKEFNVSSATVELAAKAGMRLVIARLERGTTSPQLDTVVKLLATMGKKLEVVSIK